MEIISIPNIEVMGKLLLVAVAYIGMIVILTYVIPAPTPESEPRGGLRQWWANLEPKASKNFKYGAWIVAAMMILIVVARNAF